MKFIEYFKRIIVLFSLITLSSCMRIDKSRESVAISFTPITPTNSKFTSKAPSTGPISGLTYNTDDSFGSFAFKGSDLYIPESMIHYFPATQTWHADIPYYWPADGSSLTVLSYSPFSIEASVTCTDPNVGIIITDHDVLVEKDTDVMVADVVSASSNTSNAGYNGIPTIFRHKLAHIDDVVFKLKDNYRLGDDVTGDKKITVKDVRFHGMHHKGSYQQTPEKWTCSQDTVTMVWTFTDNNPLENSTITTPRPLNNNVDYLFLIPQSTTDVTMRIVYDVETYNGSEYVSETVVKKINISSGHTAYEVNKKYTYTITIGLDEILWAPTVEGWQAKSGSVD